MPEISRFFGIVIKMYFLDHGRPHFHAEYQEMKAKFDIETLEIIEGELPTSAIRHVREWGSKHRAELLENWRKSKLPETLDKIQPLG
ncbi:MAG TPA: DUF4160 domain-containing protein [Candidatus Kapabacteria bacterium]|jgi:hypothetical protein|nr:DUF4160 domain-containing protein [Candidatus Kapabacteria bacterium]